MRALIYKDILLILRKLSPILLVCAAPIFFSIDTAYRSIVITFSISIVVAMQILIVFSEEELSGWDVFRNAYPFSPTSLVASKYVLIFSLGLLSAGVVSGILFFVKEEHVVFFSMIAFLIVVTYNIFVVPVVFWFGYGALRYSILFLSCGPIIISRLLGERLSALSSVFLFPPNIPLLFTLFAFSTLFSFLLSVCGVLRQQKRGDSRPS